MEEWISIKKKTLEWYKSTMSDLTEQDYWSIKEFEAVAELLQNAHWVYTSSISVPKKKITNIFFSHMVIWADKSVTLYVYEGLKPLFNQMGPWFERRLNN